MPLNEPTTPRGSEAYEYAEAIWRQYRSGELDLNQAILAVLTTVMVYVAEMADAATKDKDDDEKPGGKSGSANLSAGAGSFLARLTGR
jgi:hypothetical protein